eukprot:TRINITY_DN838_c2_g1_i2.p1 TRINITY_DN838_c2_g1~~TRINITY_DN838_c2_g1_i2.p1  ORF type:complete len:311 (+),score=111.59 TRINITY_DN838_c2_g1_i2:32-934(+)
MNGEDVMPCPPREQEYEEVKDRWEPAWQEVTCDSMKAIPGKLKVVPNCSKLMDYLYLGNLASACDVELLRNHGITHVLSLTKRALPAEVTNRFSCKQIVIKDTPSTSMTDFLEEGFEHIIDAKAGGGKVLVHCRAGVSRGSCCCIAYLMKHHGMGLRKAYAHVKRCRAIAHPNKGFVEQLKALEISLRGGMSDEAMIHPHELPFTLWERVEALGLNDPIPSLQLAQKMEEVVSSAYVERYSANPYLTLDAGLGGKMELHTVELYWMGDARWIDDLIIDTLYTNRPPNSNYQPARKRHCAV